MLRRVVFAKRLGNLFVRRRVSGVGGGNVHQIARDALMEVYPDANDNEVLSFLSQAFGESGYGMSGGGFESFNGTNNWGAHQGSGNCGSIDHADTDKNGNSYVTKFAKYCTPTDGARGFFKARAYEMEPYKSAAFAAAKAGDLFGLSKALYQGGYYEGFLERGIPTAEARAKVGTPEDDDRRITEYAKMLMNNAQWVVKGLGVPNNLFIDPNYGRGWDTLRKVAAGALIVGAGLVAFTHVGQVYAMMFYQKGAALLSRVV